MRTRYGFVSLAIFVCLQFAGLQNAPGAPCTVLNKLTNGQTADANQVMSNFTSATNCIDAVPAGFTNSVQIKGTSGLAGVGPLTNGQVLIGSTGAHTQATTHTFGNGISVTHGVGVVTITATSEAGTSYDLVFWPKAAYPLLANV
ncbi:hypothetical protein [Rhodoferax sp. GW822-FHT02A01]|uniref:hypothetical protein n=1 Tax=Rhodoferax sp. GW822-FHT02A01 TaxID=3141537 RepID=UPI00315D2711